MAVPPVGQVGHASPAHACHTVQHGRLPHPSPAPFLRAWAACPQPRPEHVCCMSQAVESIQAEDESAKLCKRRIEHLKEHSSDQPAAAGMWKRKRMDRMMVEHLLRCGYYNTAVRLARQSGIEVRLCWGRGPHHGQARDPACGALRVCCVHTLCASVYTTALQGLPFVSLSLNVSWRGTHLPILTHQLLWLCWCETCPDRWGGFPPAC